MTPETTIPPGCARCKALIQGITASNRIAARLQDRLTEAEKITLNLTEEIRRLKATQKKEATP
jgi:hypothetical protein